MASRTRPARGQTRSIHVRSKAALLNWIFSPQTRLANVKLLHRIISQASGNPILAALMETVTSSMYDRRSKTVGRSIDLRESAEMHREIFRAIRARNPQEARRLMEQHLRLAQIAQDMERPSPRTATKGSAQPKRRLVGQGSARS